MSGTAANSESGQNCATTVFAAGSQITKMRCISEGIVDILGEIRDSALTAKRINVKGFASGQFQAETIVLNGRLENATIQAARVFIVDGAHVENCEFNLSSYQVGIGQNAHLTGRIVFNMPTAADLAARQPQQVSAVAQGSASPQRGAPPQKEDDDELVLTPEMRSGE